MAHKSANQGEPRHDPCCFHPSLCFTKLHYENESLMLPIGKVGIKG